MHQPISEVIKVESELRTVLIAHPADTAQTLRDILDRCLSSADLATHEEARLQHIETHLLPALEAFGVEGRIERGETGVAIRLQALSGTAQTGLAMVELEYDVRAGESRFLVAASITLGALVGCMLRAGAKSFDVVREEARSALERAALWRRGADKMPCDATRPFGAFMGSLDPAGVPVLHSYEGTEAIGPSALAA